MQADNERRKYQRYPVHYDVLCTDVNNSSGRKIHATAHNASRTGFKVGFPGDLPQNTQLKLEILKSISSDPIVAYGKVVWKKASPLVYGERIAGIHISKIGWTETDKLITNLDI